MATLPPPCPSLHLGTLSTTRGFVIRLVASLCLVLPALNVGAAEGAMADGPSKPVATVTALGTSAPPPGLELLGYAGELWLGRSPAGWHARRTKAQEWKLLATRSATPASVGLVVAGTDVWYAFGNASSADGARSATRIRIDGDQVTFASLPAVPGEGVVVAATMLGKRLLALSADAEGSFAGFHGMDPERDSAWTTLPAFPGALPKGLVGAVNFNEWLLVAPNASQAWGYREKPVDGTDATGWFKRQAPSSIGADTVLIPSSTAHFTLISGTQALVYNLVLDRWYASTAEGLPSGALVASTRTTGQRLMTIDGASEFSVEFAKPDYRLSLLDYAAIGLYFIVMVWVGLAFSGKGETSAQFALGNRDVKWWAAGISMFATGASSISFLAIPALAFATNLVWFFPGLMLIVGYFITAHIIFPLLRRLEITSTYEYLDRRFNRGLRLLASAQCIIFQTFGRMSVILVLPALAISAVSGMDVLTSVLLMGVLTTIYTAIGGFNAVIWTDVFQGVLMIGAPLLVIGYALVGTPGGPSTALESAMAYDKMRLVVASWDLSLPVFWVMLFGGFLNIAASVGDQPVIQRVFSVPMKQVRRTALMSSLCGIVISILTYAMGTAIFSFYHGNPEGLPPVISNDQIVPLFIVQNLPAGICGLVVASVFAAAMSTLSSSMNSVATLVCVDFFKPLFPNASDKANLRLMRVVSYAVGAVGTGAAVYMAQQEMTSMFAVWNKIVAMLGGGFVGIYILGVFTTRTNSAGAILGGLTSIGVTIWVDRSGSFHWVAYAPMAITSCLIVGYVTSLLTGGSRRDLAGLTAFTANAGRKET